MATGMKKINENVIASGRSLTLIDDQVRDNLNIQAGALKTLTKGGNYPVEVLVEENNSNKTLNIDYTDGLRYKSGTNKYVSFDAKGMLTPFSIDAEVMLETHSIFARALNTGCVLTDKIAEQAVTTPKIKDLNVTTEKINNLAVTNDKLGDSSVTNIKIANTTIVAHEKIVPSTITTPLIVDYNVISRKIGDGAVIERTIGVHAVTTEKIADDAVTNVQIADQTILSTNIRDEEVKVNNLATDSVSTVKIQNGAVTTPKIAQWAVKGGKTSSIDLETITADNIATGAITSRCIENETIVTEDLHNECVTMEKLDPKVFRKVDQAVIYEDSNPPYPFTDKTTATNSSMVFLRKMNENEEQIGDTDLYVSGNIYAHGNIEGLRVYNMAYSDLAEGYIPGEELEPGDIVELREDGKVYKAYANGLSAAIVGVVSDEFAACYGATEAEIVNGEKVAVALIGRVHVKVQGPIRLGQEVRVNNIPGVGRAWSSNKFTIGRALETVRENGEHKVLCLVRPC